MKESKIMGIGVIPNHWEIKRLKDIISCFDFKRIPLNAEERGSKQTNKLYPYFGSTQIMEYIDDFIFDGEYILLGEDGAPFLEPLRDVSQIVVGKFWANNHVHVLRAKYGVNKFYSHYLNCVNYSEYVSGSTRLKLNQSSMDLIMMVVPPKEQQIKIANYLDIETSKIDHKISILEQKYEKLEEYKQSVIFETVTKGLNSNVEMKDSGIASTGTTPNTWKISRIKDLFKIGRGRVIAASEVEKEQTDINSYPVYSAATENNGIIGYINTFDFNQPLLTWTTDGAKAGTVFIRDGKFNCTNVCGTLIAKNKQKNLKFYKYALEVQTPHYKRSDINGAKIMNNEMAAILITEPSSEQEKNAIVDYLDTFTSKIDKKKEIIKKQIDLLKEYKQSLIYEAVTGKLDIK